MNLYDFCLAIARHADRRVGVAVSVCLVEEHFTVLNRTSTEDEFRSAFHGMLRTFAPHEEVGLISVPFSARAMARFLLDVLTCGCAPPREVWQHNPMIQSHLASAMRHLVADLCKVPTPQKRKRPAARAPQHRNQYVLTIEENACLQWGNITSDAAYIMTLAERLRCLKNPIDRQTVLEAIRDDIVHLPAVTLRDFANLLETYTAVPAAKA